MLIAIASFLFFTILVAVLTWRFTKHDDLTTTGGYFLAGRSLSFPLIAGSLLLTNLSTEQMVGLNGQAFTDGLCVMVWEIVCIVALVFMAWFFLPRFLKSGVATVPEYLGIRFDRQTQTITNLIFLLAYVGILLPIILYTGATGIIGIFNMDSNFKGLAESFSVDPYEFCLWAVVLCVGVIGSIYALFGGLKTVAVSDTLNGIGLFVGGFAILYFGLLYLGDGEGVGEGFSRMYQSQTARFNSIGGPKTSVPFGTVFSGIFLLHLFYWTTNQQIIQRTLGASSLAEGQKGVLFTGALKLLGPLYLVIPGMIAFSIFSDQEISKDLAYGKLVNLVLPPALTGFFAAAILGAVLSSFNSALNSSCTLFSIGIYKNLIRPKANEKEIVRAGKIFGWAVAIGAMVIAPLLNHPVIQEKGIFDYLQKMNGMYFIPIFAVVLTGMLTRRVPPIAAKLALVLGLTVISLGYFVEPFPKVVASIHDFHFLGLVFAWLVIFMLVYGEVRPTESEFVQEDVGAVDMTPWRLAKPVGLFLILIVFLIYGWFADFSVLLNQ
ncbi:MAG: solute:sodium symporter family transporter [Planctomycetota bacterium]